MTLSESDHIQYFDYKTDSKQIISTFVIILYAYWCCSKNNLKFIIAYFKTFEMITTFSVIQITLLTKKTNIIAVCLKTTMQ